MPTMMMTAPTPMTIPNIVRKVRILFFRMLCVATRISVDFLMTLAPRSCPALPRLRAVHHGRGLIRLRARTQPMPVFPRHPDREYRANPPRLDDGQAPARRG